MQLVKLLFVWMLIFGIIWLIFVWKRDLWKKIQNWVENWSDRRIEMGLFLLDLLAQGWLVFLRKLPFIADEVYTLSGAAFFAGYDWSKYMHLHKFYNFGYTMLLMPIYKLSDDPVVIYRIMLFMNIVLHAFTITFSYRIVKIHMHSTKLTGVAIALTSTCSSLILFFKGFVYNEMPLAFIVWLIALLLLELARADKKRRWVLSVLLGMITAYGYIVHSRCLIIFGTLVIVIGLYLLIYRKWIAQPLAFVGAFAVCFYLEKQLIDYVEKKLYLIGEGVVLGNSVEHVATGTWQYSTLTSLKGIRTLILQFFSLAGAMTIETGGLLTLVTVAALYYVFKNFKKYKRGKMDPAVFLLTNYSVISFWGSVFCISLMGASNGKLRFLIYSRYFTPFIGTFLALGLWVLSNRSCLNKKWLGIWSGLITMIVGAEYALYTMPRLYESSMKDNASLYFFMAFARYEKQNKFTRGVVIIAVGLLVIFTVIQMFLYCRKQFIASCMVALIFSVILFWRIEQRQCAPASERRYQASNATYALLEEYDLLEDSEVACIGTEVFRKAVLVSSYDKDIEFDKDNIWVNEDTVLLSNQLESLKEYTPAYIFRLDNNEWIGIWSSEVKELLEEQYQLWVQ